MLDFENRKKKSKPILEKAKKAYDNSLFLHSKDARILRIMSEYLYPERSLKERNIDKLIIFFGSARIASRERYDYYKKTAMKDFKEDDDWQTDLQVKLDLLEKRKPMIKYYDAAREIAKLIGKWTLTLPENKRFHICTGGGPGVMEAANRGACEAGATSIGMNISLPFEQMPNQYINPDLNYEFHYFFMRKFWLIHLAQGLIVFPGGFGTIDELSETLTLKQTGKITRDLPIILYDSKFWRDTINFEGLVEHGLISPENLQLFEFADTPKAAFKQLINKLTNIHKLNGQS